MLKISVIMSVYNAARFLAGAVKSILDQTFKDFELIIINDGSTDRTPKIIKSFIDSDERIRLIDNQANLGLTKSLNIALSQAQGKYIARLDADDVSLPERLQRQYDFMEENSEVALVGSGAVLIDENGVVIGERQSPSEDYLIKFDFIFSKPSLYHSSFFFRKEAVAKLGGYDEQYKSSQDFDLLTRLARQSKISCLAEKLIQLRVHSASVTRKLSKANILTRDGTKIYFNNLNTYIKLDWEKFKVFYLARKQVTRSLTGLFSTLKLMKKIFKAFITKEGLSREQIAKLKPRYLRERRKIIRRYAKSKLSF